MRAMALLLFSVLGPHGLAIAAEEVDCSTLENAEERLACYDARFQEKSVEPPVAEAEKEAPQIVSEPVRSTEPQAAEPPPVAPVDSKEEGKTWLFGSPKVDITSTIRAIRAGEKQKMVFRLENDQIWIQATPRPLPFQVGDTVTIKNAFFGGYFMSTEKGLSTRVQRIK